MTDHLLDRLVAAVGTQYLVDAEIGRGGMAVVYRATDLRLHRRVAIKVLPPELAFNPDVRERFLREAQTSAQLAHPHIVPIYTVDEREGLVYFVMALVEGESLAERLRRDIRLPIADARRILADVADALAYAHGRGVVHRDVKPDNVMLERATGRAVVTDFGIARAAAGDSRLTVTGVAVGTPAYMSPEQALGERELDGRSDIYSLGVVAYQMLSGETPFKAANTPAMLVKHLSESPRPLQALRPDAPPPLVHAIMRALAKKPENRWSDASEFRAAVTGQHEAAAYVDPAPVPRAEPAPPARAELPPAHYESPFQDRNRREQGRMGPGHDLAHMPPLPPLPTFGSRAEWKQWRRMQRDWDEERKRRERHAFKARRNFAESDPSRPIEQRISSWRNNALGGMSTVAVLGVVNALTSFGHWWFVFPGAFITLGVLTKGGKLWADGVPLDRLLSRGKIDLDSPHGAPRVAGGPDLNQLALKLASPDVLAGPHGQAVRRAADDRAAVEETIARLAPAEREMIPDVLPTVVALSERVGSLALTLHRLDQDVSGTSVASLDERLAALHAQSGPAPTAEQERRIALLERQRGTIVELVERRQVLAAQLESAGLALQNLRLDLLKLRSSGLGSAMSDLTSATQEARAISRDIGHAVDAVSEVRKL